jgi:S-adenosylmethionine:tRNA ribosyltransferase-isomerase
MRAATVPVQRPRDARLLVVDAAGRIAHRPRSELAEVLVPGDLVVANDAATLPASLAGRHVATGATVEVRLAGRASLAADDVRTFVAVVFGAGDHRTPTERRPLPPPLAPGDALVLGPLGATVVRLLDHPRLVELRFAGDADAIRAGIARHGRPVQYAHLAVPLALWDVWTRIAALPVAFEAPSAGFVLDWRLLDRLAQRGVGFATLTHAAGLSSTGDAALDARLPLDEPYRIPASTVAAIAATVRRGGRSSRSARRSRARSSMRRRFRAARCRCRPRRQPTRRRRAWRSSMPSSAEPTSRERAITICCVRSFPKRR